MRVWGLAAICVLAGVARAAPPATSAPAAQPVVITQPDWLAKPNGEDLANAYPQFAWRLDLGGRAVIRCQIDEFGRLQDCRVLEEQPAGLRFGEAALTISKAFHMRPMSRNGVPVAGGIVNIPIRFVVPDAPPDDPPPAPTSARALELARQLMRDTDAMAVTRASFDQQMQELELISRPDIDDDARQAVVAALRQAYPPRLREAGEAFARLYAHVFTAAQLEQILAFAHTPAGKVTMQPDDEARAVETMVNRERARLAMEAARDAYCATRDCSTEPDVAGLARDAAGAHPKVMIPAATWAQEPSETQVELVRPILSKELGVGGAIRLTCTVGALGVLKDCAVAREAPPGLGFGPAALTLASSFRLSPELIARGAVGETVAVFVSFAAPDRETTDAYSGVPPRSAESMALARQITATPEVSTYADAWRRRVAAHPDQLPSGVTLEQFQAAGQAIIAGSTAAERKVSDLRAAYLTQRATDAELKAAIAFMQSDAGRAWRSRIGELAVEREALDFTFERLVSKDAGQIFCRTRGCPGPPAAAAQPSGARAAPSTPRP